MQDVIDRMTSTALKGDLSAAIAVLNQSGLNEDQKAKIASILNEPRSDMQKRIVAVVGEENIASTAASSEQAPSAHGGTVQVAPPAEYHSAIQSLQTNSHFIGVELCSDVMGRLFYTCVSECGFKTLAALASVCKHWNHCLINFWERCDLKPLCPELTILDAETQKVECEDEPKINKLQLLKWVREISPHVEGNAGVTQLTMTKGTTLNQLIEIAKGEGMIVDVQWDRIIEELGDVPVEQTYGILITNNVFLNSRDNNVYSQEMLVKGHGCEMPTVQEYVALCVFTNKVFKKSLYGQSPWTNGRSSMIVGNYPLSVGGSTSARLEINYGHFDNEDTGSGGQRKFYDGPLVSDIDTFDLWFATSPKSALGE
jgi:hypothetical protein